MADRYRVSATELNLRSKPVVTPSNRIAVLPQGQLVIKLSEADAGWWRVSTTLHSQSLEGFVASRYLEPEGTDVVPKPRPGLRAVHLETSEAVSRNNRRWAFMLNEVGAPHRDGTDPVGDIAKIIRWLDVDHSDRYKPTPSTTYCNIYAYDFGCLAGAYVPRVWWSSKAVADLLAGKSVSPVYGVTVREMNANALTNWFEDFGADFGWRRTFDLGELQDAANRGKPCIICAQRTDLNRSGHIVAVVPETDAHRARRSGSKVTAPVQSQAGRNNYPYIVRVWWTGQEFRKFGFWING